MEIFFGIANDLVVILGNLIIFSCMLNFNALKLYKKIILCVMCVLFSVAYTLCVYVAEIPIIHATLFCFTLPSLVLFWIISDIKDSRFFLSFCLVDSISLVFAFIMKYASLYFEGVAPFIMLGIDLLLYTAIIVGGYKYFLRYAELITFQKSGWRTMMLASFLIYFAQYFLASYPKPLKERMEYGPMYLVFCAVVVACYCVFFNSMVKSKKLHEQNEELENEKKYHRIAYLDSLTGLYNRVYYVEKINEVERNRENYRSICCVILDLNNFKSTNDTYGHHSGDVALQNAAKHITYAFQDLPSYIFRIGGDEFSVLLLNVEEEEVKNRLSAISGIIGDAEDPTCPEVSMASGYCFASPESGPHSFTIEQCFREADKNMYTNKKRYKEELASLGKQEKFPT